MKIVISGTVGVGKTEASKELLKLLEKKSSKPVLFKEFQNQEHSLIDFFYENKQHWAFVFQIDMLLNRFKNYFFSPIKKNEIVIFDRHFLDDFFFCAHPQIWNNFDDLEKKFYINFQKKLLQKLKDNNQTIDYFFLLKDKFESVQEKVNNRGMKSELKTPEDYWEELYYVYYNNNNIHEIIKSSVEKLIILDVNGKNPKEIAKMIASYLN